MIIQVFVGSQIVVAINFVIHDTTASKKHKINSNAVRIIKLFNYSEILNE